MRFTFALILMTLAVSGCRSFGSAERGTPRVQLMYFNPAQRPLSPVSAATVTLMNTNDARSFDIDVDVKSTADSALLIVLRDDVSLDELKPQLGSNGIEHVRRSQREAPSNMALPLIDVSAEGSWKPLKKNITSVLVKSLSGRCLPSSDSNKDRYVVIRPSSTMTLRVRQIVYPVPEARNGRYRVRVNWISFPAESSAPTPRDPASALFGAAPECPLLKGSETAVADDLEAYGRRLSVNWWGATALGVVLFIAGMAITGS